MSFVKLKTANSTLKTISEHCVITSNNNDTGSFGFHACAHWNRVKIVSGLYFDNFART